MNVKQTPSTHKIQDLETLRVISDPLRAQILELCATEARTVRDMASRLGLAPTRLYYHINLLEKHGLLVVDETRTVGNLIEKTYRAVAVNLDVDSSLFNFKTPQGKESLYGLVTSTLDSTRDDLLRSLQARSLALEQGAAPTPRAVMLKRVTARLSIARIDAMLARLEALLDEFDQNDAADDQAYNLTLAYYPVFYYPEDNPKPPDAGENAA